MAGTPESSSLAFAMGKPRKPPVKITRVTYEAGPGGTPPVTITRVQPASSAVVPAAPTVTGSGMPPVKITRVDAHGAPIAPPPAEPAAETPAAPSQDQVNQLTALYRSGEMQSALELARGLAEDFPQSPPVWNIRGAAARALGQIEEAERSFLRLEELQPGFAGAPYNLALVHEDRGRIEQAINAYLRALRADPSLAQAHNNLAILLNRMGETQRALGHLEQARALRPEMPELCNSHGNALRNAGRRDEARAAYEEAVRLRPDFVSALYNLGALEQEAGNPQEAIGAFERVLEIAPGNAIARTSLMHQLARICDWDRLEPHIAHLPALGIETDPVTPFALLAMEDNLARQSARARNWAQKRYGHVRRLAPAPARPTTRPERLKIGYYSGNYRDHPMVQLLAGPFRAHDRTRFEVHAISCGPDRDEEGRRTAERLCDHFHDVRELSDTAIAERIRELGIDLLIDHDGYTTDNRTNPVAMKPAPVQINMLGYPGTLGAPHHDYIICDPITVPQSDRVHYTEKLMQMPHSYQANDNRMAIAEDAGSRADHGLPENAFVFACFNANWKLTRREFAIWMRVLEKTPGSVLWLRRTTALSADNLRAAAQAQGIDPARLVFADFTPLPDHLARHAHANLFLDTFAYGSHTTGTDALWAGQPFVTRLGEQFAARAASSLLMAAGLEQMVTHSDEEYEALILDLAHDPARLGAIKAELVGSLTSVPLFDTEGYTRHLEAGLDAAYDRWLRGEEPADITIEA